MSVDKLKYPPKFTELSNKREGVKSQKNRFSLINFKTSSEKRLLTEAPLINPMKQLKKSLTIKDPKAIEFSENKNDNFKLINVRSSKKLPSKELDNIYSIMENEDDNILGKGKRKNKYQIRQLNNGFSLPIIKKSLPLKDILSEKNIMNINKKILKKQINKNENHLINYLKLDKTIKPSFIEKLNKADNDRLVKLDKICQKYFNDRKRNDILQQNIQDKIKLEYSNDSKYCRENLINMQKNIQGYKKIYKSYFKSNNLRNNY